MDRDDKALQTYFCIERYLRKQRRYYREIVVIQIIIDILFIIAFFGSIVLAGILFQEDATIWRKLIIGVIIAIVIIVGSQIGEWRRDNIMVDVKDTIKSGRYVYKDAKVKVLAKHDEDMWLYALVEASLNRCGDKDLYGRLITNFYYTAEEYVAMHRGEIEDLCDKYKVK